MDRTGIIGGLLSLTMLLAACAGTGTPEGIEPVEDFNAKRYMGKWYEIARLDHSFERGLSNVTAQYSLNDNGTVDVINRGWSEADSEWSEADGKAKFVQSPDVAHLKVSFFGPFYGSYVVFELDQNDYHYAFVAGDDRENLWLLARTPEVDDAIVERFVSRARILGFEVDDLIFVEQNRHEPRESRVSSRTEIALRQ